MDTLSIGRVALMSFHPAHARNILCGEKRVEFRRRRLPDDVTHVVIYSTQPVGAITGAFQVADQKVASPDFLWSLFADHGCLSSESFDKYFESCENATGILIGELLLLESPLELQDSLGICRPPQSFQYISQDAAAKLFGYFRMADVSAGDLT